MDNRQSHFQPNRRYYKELILDKPAFTVICRLSGVYFIEYTGLYGIMFRIRRIFKAYQEFRRVNNRSSRIVQSATHTERTVDLGVAPDTVRMPSR